MLHPLPLPLSSCLGCIPPLIGLPSLRFYAVGSSLFLLSVCFCLCSLFYRDDVLCWLLLARPFLYAFHAHLRFPVDLVWFRLSCDHGWIRSGSVNVRKQQQQQQLLVQSTTFLADRWFAMYIYGPVPSATSYYCGIAIYMPVEIVGDFSSDCIIFPRQPFPYEYKHY